MPRWINPQLAVLSDTAPNGTEWVHETKFDGYRILAFLEAGTVTLYTRNHLNWTKTFDPIANSLVSCRKVSAIIDGEVCVLDEDGHSSFKLLQKSIKHDTPHPFIYFAFDLLYLNGIDCRTAPLFQRKKLLKEFCIQLPNKNIRYTEHIKGSGDKVFRAACSMHWEGIISKLANAPYSSGRGKSWRKSKCIKEEEFIIVGYTPHSVLSGQIGALLLSERTKSKALRYCGKVGTGFNAQERRELFQTLLPQKVNTPQCEEAPRFRNVIWVRPRIVVQITFTEKTSDGRLRHPVYLGERLDKSAKDVET